MPRYEDLDWRGLEDFTRQQFNELMSIDRDLWQHELLSHEELFVKLYDRLPKELLGGDVLPELRCRVLDFFLLPGEAVEK